MTRAANRKRNTRAVKPAGGRVLVSAAAAKRFSVGAAWVAALGALVWGLVQLDDVAATAYADSTAYPTRLQWVDPPPWLYEPDYAVEPYATVLEELTARVDLQPDHDPSYAGLCGWVYERAAASPWLADVRRVTKRADNVVQVYADFRQPLTYVLHGGLAYLVDPNGVVLTQPQALAYERSAAALPLIGVARAPAPPGQMWVGDDLQAGLKLVAVLQRAERADRLPLRPLLAAVDVSAYESLAAGPLKIRTVHDTTIIWGKTPAAEYESEADADRKLAHLLALYNELGGLPAGQPVIDIRDPDRILYRQ